MANTAQTYTKTSLTTTQ